MFSVAVRLAVAVPVRVLVGVWVEVTGIVPVDVLIAVAVAVGTAVDIVVAVLLAVDVGVAVDIVVALPLAVDVGVTDVVAAAPLAVGVGVAVDMVVAVRLAVGVGIALDAAVTVRVAVAAGVKVVAVRVAVATSLVAVGVTLAPCVPLGVAVGALAASITTKRVTSATDRRLSPFTSLPAQVTHASQNGACSSSERSVGPRMTLQSTSPRSVKMMSETQEGACGQPGRFPASNGDGDASATANIARTSRFALIDFMSLGGGRSCTLF